MIPTTDHPTVQLLAGNLRVSTQEVCNVLKHIPCWWSMGWNAIFYEYQRAEYDDYRKK